MKQRGIVRYKKAILIFGLLILYFAFLSVVSHIIASSKNKTESDFTSMDCLEKMVCSREAMRNDDGSVSITEGDTLYGPYIDLKVGNYIVTIENDRDAPFRVYVTESSGAHPLTEAMIDSQSNAFPLILSEDATQVEIVIEDVEATVLISGVRIENVNELPAELNSLAPASENPSITQEEMSLTEYLGKMQCSREGMRNEDGSISITPGDTLYGPYIDLKEGNYIITIENDRNTPFKVRVTKNTGAHELTAAMIDSQSNAFPLILSEDATQVEIVIEDVEATVLISGVRIEIVNELPAELNSLAPASENPSITQEEMPLTEYLGKMQCSREGIRQGNGSVILSGEDDVLFGPYLDIEKGDYCIRMNISLEGYKSMAVTSGYGETLLKEIPLDNGNNEIILQFDEAVKGLEFVIRGSENEIVEVSSLKFGSYSAISNDS